MEVDISLLAKELLKDEKFKKDIINSLNGETVKLREVCPSCGVAHYLHDLNGNRWCQVCATHWHASEA